MLSHINVTTLQSGAGDVTTDDEYYDLGRYQRPVTTRSSRAQRWFNRGLIWTHSFNHHEAAKCFEHAIAADATCAMAYWGLAYALGPHYNKPWTTFSQMELKSTLGLTYTAVQQAKLHSMHSCNPVECALIHALQHRYNRDGATVDDCMSWNLKYADAMKAVYESFPDDLDVEMLYADALLNLSPWALWDLQTGKPASAARTVEVQKVLTRALQKPGGDDHPGLLHLYIHFIEMSDSPELGVKAADHLRSLVPDAGHLLHMPSHLDLLFGDYRRAMDANMRAIQADEKYVARSGQNNFYTNYRVHNYHSLVYAAMFAGNYAVALNAAACLEKTIPESLLLCESPPMANFLEAYLSTRPHVLIRFGKWRTILDLPFPSDSQLYCVLTATIHFAKGIANAVLGNIDAAEHSRQDFLLARDQVPPTRTAFPNSCLRIFEVAAAMLDGELEYRRGNVELGLESLRQAVRLDDSLTYNEPWGWMQPARHALAALLLEQGQVEESARVYAADLGLNDDTPRARHHPLNVWALHGFHECLRRLGRNAEARLIEPQLKLALQHADVEIPSSCFCRRSCKSKASRLVAADLGIESVL